MTTAPSLLQELKGLRVMVVHPRDGEAKLVIGHLRRIGCQVEICWPVPPELERAPDVLLLSIEADQRDAIQKLTNSLGEQAPPIIAIVGYENPSMLQLVLETRPAAVIERPLHPFGLLTQLMMARAAYRQRREERIAMQQQEARRATIALAKALLMVRENLDEKAAHRRLQREAMSRRDTMEAVAERLIRTLHH
ncbi:ANTAR domain-containing response regulator [Vreelandella janggokensis]|uniref:ANTAR domain-containing response regulator n=1 Tax=Vreelandella janggokensis TaxID=370767 RepID=UPI0028648DF6|nr:ANTAR domain-containing protein [Halomonas janggokensis]MDR5886426.1 ANTAR domain-containing protein [Halomonas janggokensis]